MLRDLCFNVLGIILMAIPAWDTLDKRGIGWSPILMAFSALAGLGLVAWSVWRSSTNGKRLTKLSRENEELRASLASERMSQAELDRKKALIGRAAILRDLAGQANWLKGRLEEVKAWYDDDRSCTESLRYPLASSVIPDVVKEWRHKELAGWRAQLWAHIGHVAATDPHFYSQLVANKLPCDGQTYLEVLRKIDAHVVALKARAEFLVSAKYTEEQELREKAFGPLALPTSIAGSAKTYPAGSLTNLQDLEAPRPWHN